MGLWFYIGFIVFIVICLWFGSSSPKEPFYSKENGGVKVVIYENSIATTRTANLEKLLTKFNYDYDILGKGDKWSGWHGRMQTYQKYLRGVDDDAYLLFSDGRDVLVDQDAKVFADKAIRLYKDKGRKIIFNGETLCCVAGKEFKGTPEEKEKYFETIRKFFEKLQPAPAPPLYTLNFGLAFGKARDFKEMFRIMDLKPEEDDQGVLIQKIMKGEFDNYVLDYDNILFGIMFDRPPEWDPARKQLINPTTKSFPSFLHFPGESPDYKPCVTALFDAYLKQKPFD